MEMLYISLGIILILLAYYQYIQPLLIYKKVYKVLSALEKKGFALQVVKNKQYDFILENEEVIFLVRYLSVPKNAMITINSKNTWVLGWGANPHNKGKGYPHTRYLSELKSFLNGEIKKEKKTIKLILIYPCVDQVIKYLNESELAIVTSKDTPYGYKVINATEVNDKIDDLLNIK